MMHVLEICNILFDFVSFCGRQNSSLLQMWNAKQPRSRFKKKKKFFSWLKSHRHCLRIFVINSVAVARQCGNNLMSLAISVIPRYHLNLEHTEMDVRRWPIDRPLPATVIDAVSAIFEVMGFLPECNSSPFTPVFLKNGLPLGKLMALCVRTTETPVYGAGCYSVTFSHKWFVFEIPVCLSLGLL